MENDNYYLLTLVAIAKEIKQRGGKTECSVRIAAGLPLAGFGREKKPFREYLLRSSQLADGLRPVCFKFELKNRPQGLLFHSEQNCLYTSYIFRQVLKSYYIEQSFSTSVQPYDNTI